MSGALRAGDCTVSEMTVGGTDESFIDLYQFEVNEQNVDFDFSVKVEISMPFFLLLQRI